MKACTTAPEAYRRSDTAPHLYGLVWENKGLGILTSYNKWLLLGLLLPITGYEYGQCSRGWQWLAGSSADCLQAQAGKRALPRPKVDQENHADDIALALLAHQHLHAGWLSSLLCSTPPPSSHPSTYCSNTTLWAPAPPPKRPYMAAKLTSPVTYLS